MSKRVPNKRKRVPKLSFTETEGIGWHVSFRDPKTGSPTRHRFWIHEKIRKAWWRATGGESSVRRMTSAIRPGVAASRLV